MYCAAGAPNDVSYNNNTHTVGISIQYFPKDVAVRPKWTRFDLRSPIGLILRTGFEDGCYDTYHWSNHRKITNEFS